MIFNRPRRLEKKQLTWYFNERLVLNALGTYQANFTCNGDRFTKIVISNTKTLLYARNSGPALTAYNSGRWRAEEYRTITFDEEPTGNLLTWLQAHATPL